MPGVHVSVRTPWACAAGACDSRAEHASRVIESWKGVAATRWRGTICRLRNAKGRGRTDGCPWVRRRCRWHRVKGTSRSVHAGSCRSCRTAFGFPALWIGGSARFRHDWPCIGRIQNVVDTERPRWDGLGSIVTVGVAYAVGIKAGIAATGRQRAAVGGRARMILCWRRPRRAVGGRTRCRSLLGHRNLIPCEFVVPGTSTLTLAVLP
jgi:hypothetical protein